MQYSLKHPKSWGYILRYKDLFIAPAFRVHFSVLQEEYCQQYSDALLSTQYTKIKTLLYCPTSEGVLLILHEEYFNQYPYY